MKLCAYMYICTGIDFMLKTENVQSDYINTSDFI